MNTQSQTRVSQYFVAAEAQEAIEPLDVIKGDDNVDIKVDIKPEFDANDDDDFDQNRDKDHDATDEYMQYNTLKGKGRRL